MKKHCVTKRSPGCGSQRLLRCRSHPAGRGPNNSSLFPPLAAVVAVASGLTDGSRAVSTKKEDPLSELQLREGVFFRFGESNELHCFYLLYFYYMPFPAKVKRCAESLQSGPCYRGQARLSTTSQSASQTAPLVGEPLAKPFTLRGLPRPPLDRGGGIASAMTERLDYRQLHPA